MNGVIVTERSAEHDAAVLALDDEELAIVRLLAEGLVLDVIARRLALSERTVRRRLRSLCDRLGVDAPVQVVVLAARQDLL